MAVIYIVILIGVLVFVHEFGHYIAARFFKVKVLSFSIGFGPRLFGFKRGDTSWDVRLLPLGGYVSMYGTEFEEVTDKADPDYERAYNNKPIWQKAIINLAGPLFNLLFPIPILFACYFATVTDDYPSQIGQIFDNSPAVGVLESGDLITAIDGEPVKYWTPMRKLVSRRAGEAVEFTLVRDGETRTVTITPQEETRRDAMDIMRENVGRIGVSVDMASSVIGIVNSQVPAALYGLQTFDEIVSINGKSVRTYVDVERELRHNTADALQIGVLRPVLLDVPYGRVYVLAPIDVTIPGNYTTAQSLGIASGNMYLSDIDDNSPASRAGLKRGDRVVALDGESVNVFHSMTAKLQNDWENPHTLTVLRDGKEFTTTLQLEKLTITGEFQEEYPIIYSGFYHRTTYVMPEKLTKTVGERISFAASTSVEMTVKASTMLVVSIVRMFQGQVSTKSLGGPILIGHMASKAGQEGIDSFLRMMAIISINLGILNLIPIPLFDGGKLAILFVEAVKRGPLSMRTRQMIAYIGLALVLLLLMLAFKKDIERLWNLFFS